MQGKIVRGIGGFYYVHVPNRGVYECKAKGSFRNQKIKPLVGDNVDIHVLSEEKRLGNIQKILARTNALVRPAVANVDQAMVVFALASPEPNYNLLDRFLLMMQTEQIPTVICFNKNDMVSEAETKRQLDIYRDSGCTAFSISVAEDAGIQEVKRYLRGKTTVLSGPSGVGKSSLVNCIYPEAEMETGKVSEKIQRGRHTTRHSELFWIDEETYIMDTPGFSSLQLPDMEKEELGQYFPEFSRYSGECRFLGCQHISEPDCSVKDALLQGEISEVRYGNYKLFHEEIKNKKKY